MILNTLQDIIDDTKNRLNEAQNTPAGALASGSGTLIAPTDDTITRLTNECLGDLCRFGGLAIPDAATGSTAANVFFVPYSGLTVATGNTIWAARDVSYAGAKIVRIGPGIYITKYNSSVAAGTPIEWAYQGTEGFALGPVPTGVGALAVRGLAIPKPLALPADPITPFLPVDLRRYISYWNAYYIAIKNKEDGTLLARAGDWKSEYEQGKQMQLMRLLHMDPTTYAAFYAQSGVAMTGKPDGK